MDVMMSVIGWCVLGISLSGYMYVIYKRFDIKFEFIPIFLFASISMIVFLGGIIGILLPITYAVIFLGIVSFIYMLLHLKKIDWKISKLWLFHLLFAVVSLAILILLSNMKFTDYDNFSQWGMAAKEIIITNSFPIASSGSMVEYIDSPLGTASFIYFMCKFIGHTQGAMLFAQGLLIVACFYGVFGIVKDRGRFLLYGILGACISTMALFNMDSGMNSLQVDFLMPMMTLVAIVIIATYKRDFNKLYVLICPIIGLLVVTDNRGILFAIVAVLYLFYAVNKYGRVTTRKNITIFNGTTIYSEESGFRLFMKTMLFVVISFSTLVVWQVHIMLDFPEMDSILGLHIDEIMAIYVDMSGADIQQILTLYIKNILDITSMQTMGLIVFEVIGLLACIIGAAVLKKKWEFPLVYVVMNLYLVLYYVGVLGFYLYIVPFEEALVFAGIERYISSGAALFAGVITLYLFTDIEKTMKNNWKDNSNFIMIPCILLVIGMLTLTGYGLVNDCVNYQDTLAAEVESVTGDSWSSKVSSEATIIYASNQDDQVSNGDLVRIAQYYMYADHVVGVSEFEEELVQQLSEYENLVIVESDETVRLAMEGDLGIAGYQGIYDIDSLLIQLEIDQMSD